MGRMVRGQRKPQAASRRVRRTRSRGLSGSEGIVVQDPLVQLVVAPRAVDEQELRGHPVGLEAAALEPKASAYPHTEAMTYFARALGASHTGDLAKAKSSVDSLASIQQRLATVGEAYWAEQVAIQRLAAQAWLDLAEHREADALAHMREAATREDATEKNAVTPGPLAPARELLGDMLLKLNRPAAARAVYRATRTKAPNRRHSLSGAGPKA